MKDTIDEILDSHAEYYIRQTMKFFDENGESPALSKNNKGDTEAKQALHTLLVSKLPKEMGAHPNTGIGRTPQEVGFNKCRDEVISMLSEVFGE